MNVIIQVQPILSQEGQLTKVANRQLLGSDMKTLTAIVMRLISLRFPVCQEGVFFLTGILDV